jgi:hypothetical protein
MVPMLNHAMRGTITNMQAAPEISPFFALAVRGCKRVVPSPSRNRV